MKDMPRAGTATFRDVQRVLGISHGRLAAAGERGEVPLKKIGGRWFSRWEWITAFCETGTWNPDVITVTPESAEPIRPEAV
jgi:hypothetical protein